MPTDLWAYLRPERPALACGGAALLVSTFSNAFAPRAMGRVVDAYAARRRDGGAALRRELAATGLVFACGALASGVRTACFAGACQGALRRLDRGGAVGRVVALRSEGSHVQHDGRRGTTPTSVRVRPWRGWESAGRSSQRQGPGASLCVAGGAGEQRQQLEHSGRVAVALKRCAWL